MNALNKFQKILEMVKFFIGNNSRPHKLFVRKHIRHLTKSSPLFTDKFFTDKVLANI